MRVPVLLAGIVMAGIVMAGLAAPVWAGDGAIPGGQGLARRISVQGHGVVSARPDIAVLRAGVTGQAPSAKAALAAHNRIMTGLLAALRSFGLAERDLQSQQVDLRAIFPKRRQNDADPAPSSFQATGHLRIRLREVDRLGELLDQMAAVGVNNLSGLRFAIAEPAPLRDEARRRAVQDARHRARLYAAEAGVQLGPVLRISESGAGGPVREFRAMANSSAGGPTAPGETEISVTVNMVFAIK